MADGSATPEPRTVAPAVSTMPIERIGAEDVDGAGPGSDRAEDGLTPAEIELARIDHAQRSRAAQALAARIGPLDLRTDGHAVRPAVLLARSTSQVASDSLKGG
jgi:hypothetical protein